MYRRKRTGNVVEGTTGRTKEHSWREGKAKGYSAWGDPAQYISQLGRRVEVSRPDMRHTLYLSRTWDERSIKHLTRCPDCKNQRGGEELSTSSCGGGADWEDVDFLLWRAGQKGKIRAPSTESTGLAPCP